MKLRKVTREAGDALPPNFVAGKPKFQVRISLFRRLLFAFPRDATDPGPCRSSRHRLYLSRATATCITLYNIIYHFINYIHRSYRHLASIRAPLIGVSHNLPVYSLVMLSQEEVQAPTGNIPVRPSISPVHQSSVESLFCVIRIVSPFLKPRSPA